MGFKQRTLDLINAERQARGRLPLQMSSALEEIAQNFEFSGCPGGMTVFGRCDDMGARQYFDHGIHDCFEPNLGHTHMLAAAGISTAGGGVPEILGMDSAQDSELAAAQRIHDRFMAENENDPNTHKAMMLDGNKTHVGIGLFRTAPGQVWMGMTRVFVTCELFARNPQPAHLPGFRYHTLTPARILDTRLPAPDKLGAGARSVQVTGKGGVPPGDVRAVVLNVTVHDPSANSFLTAWPAGQPQPNASNLNYTPGVTVANLVMVKVGAGGQVMIANAAGETHVIVDVAGWFGGGRGASGFGFHALSPSRILDTRLNFNSNGPIGPGATLNAPVLGQGGIPNGGAAAAVLNITAATPTAPGFLTVFPADEAQPNASNLNFATGKTVANLVVAKVGPPGAMSIFNQAGQTHAIADVAGWFQAGAGPGSGGFHPVNPKRILDTRIGIGAPVAKVGPGATLTLEVGGNGGVPVVGASAVVMNVTAVFPSAPESFLTVFPTGEPKPNASNLFYNAGQIVPNLVVCKLGAGGQVSLNNSAGAVDLIADVAGWFDAG